MGLRVNRMAACSGVRFNLFTHPYFWSTPCNVDTSYN